MKPAYWSPTSSTFTPTQPPDFLDLEPTEKMYTGVDSAGEKYSISEICQLVEAMLYAGHMSNCTHQDKPAVETLCECGGWQVRPHINFSYLL